MSQDYYTKSMKLHEKLQGKIEIRSKARVHSMEDLSLTYTPGVAEPCRRIHQDPAQARDLTIIGRSIAVITDGSAVLGLGNIGPKAAMPVMEGKALIFKEFAGLDAWPICLATQDTEEIIQTVRNIAPGFGGINLEDISAPRCFEIEERLQDLGIPVFHDDQHGTAIVALAALINACRVLNRRLEDLRVVINGSGAAGIAIARLLRCVGHEHSSCIAVKEIVVCDSRGAIHEKREDLNPIKKSLLAFSNFENRAGSIHEVIQGMDVFIGVSQGGLLKSEHIRSMKQEPIIIAMANPEPEIHPDLAREGGAAIIGTGRSDYPNQVNNALVFPGIFKGTLQARAARISPGMKIAAARALADCLQNPSREQILPQVFQDGVTQKISEAVRLQALEEMH